VSSGSKFVLEGAMFGSEWSIFVVGRDYESESQLREIIFLILIVLVALTDFNTGVYY
jgi:hypothetical protein